MLLINTGCHNGPQIISQDNKAIRTPPTPYMKLNNHSFNESWKYSFVDQTHVLKTHNYNKASQKKSILVTHKTDL